MATSTLTDINVTGEWQDIVATHPSVATANVAIQNVSAPGDIAQVVFGGSSAPSGKTGTLLDYMNDVRGNSANVWVRALDGGSLISVVTI